MQRLNKCAHFFTILMVCEFVILIKLPVAGLIRHRMLEQLRELRMYGLTQLVFNFGQVCFCMHMLYGYSDIMMLDTFSTVLFV